MLTLVSSIYSIHKKEIITIFFEKKKDNVSYTLYQGGKKSKKRRDEKN